MAEILRPDVSNEHGELWKVDDLASFLSVSPRTIRKWVLIRFVPYLKIGRAVRFDPNEIKAWVARGRRTPSEPPDPVQSALLAELQARRRRRDSPGRHLDP